MQAWLVPVSKENWGIYKANEFKFLAFTFRARKRVSEIEIGDAIILYIASRISVLSGILRAKSILNLETIVFSQKKMNRRRELKWDEIYNCRIDTEPEIILKENQFVSLKNLINNLKFIEDKNNYYRCLQTSLTSIPLSDYKLIRKEIEETVKNKK